MDLNLTRVDLCQLGTVSQRRTMVIMPTTKNPKQKFVVGEDSGQVQCYRIKRGDVEQVFNVESSGCEVDAVALGGALGKKDKVFICRGNVVEGFGKSGKNFFKFNTQLTDTGMKMCVEGKHIYCIQEYMYGLFEDAKHQDLYMSPDPMNSLAIEHITTADSDSKYDAVVGCQDSHLRVVSGSECNIECATSGPVECVSRYGVNEQNGKRSTTAGQKCMIYGMSNGIVAQVEVHGKGGEGEEGQSLRNGWKVEGSTRQAQVNCISSFDMTMDDVHDVLVGRDDGVVQVFGFDMGTQPAKQFEVATSESCRSLGAGIISSAGFQELLMCSFSGRVLSLTSERLYSSLEAGDKKGRSKGKAESDDKKEALTGQLDRLRSKIDTAKETASRNMQRQAAEQASVAVGQGEGVLGVYGAPRLPTLSKPFKISSSFLFAPEDGTYKITLETPCNLSMVLLQSTVHVDVVDLENNEAIMTKCPIDKKDPVNSKNALLASYRCAAKMKRIEMVIRTVEGQFGTVQAFVVADVEPRSAQIVKFNVKPLSLHTKVDAVEGFEDRPLNSLSFTGKFGIRMAHEWMLGLFPDYSSQLPKGAATHTIHFSNVFLGSGLQCTYEDNKILFRSDNISTVAILKEALTTFATARNVRVSTSFEVRDSSVEAMLRRIDPKLLYQSALAKKVELIKGLTELDVQEDDTSYLDAEYAEILHNRDRIQREYKQSPTALHNLYGAVTDLYIDYHKFRGRDVRKNMGAISECLTNYDLVVLIERFNIDAEEE